MAPATYTIMRRPRGNDGRALERSSTARRFPTIRFGAARADNGAPTTPPPRPIRLHEAPGTVLQKLGFDDTDATSVEGEGSRPAIVPWPLSAPPWAASTV